MDINLIRLGKTYLDPAILEIDNSIIEELNNFLFDNKRVISKCKSMILKAG